MGLEQRSRPRPWAKLLVAVGAVCGATYLTSQHVSAPTTTSLTRNLDEDADGERAPKSTSHTEKQTKALEKTYSGAHILFLLVDDQGFNDIGYNTLDLAGSSPTIDNLAESGIILDNYYSQHLCTPARASLLTGVLPYHLGVQHEVILPAAPWGVPLSRKFLPDYLSDFGYISHMVGKWHLGFFQHAYLPTKRGFDSFYGFLSDQENYYDREYPYPIGDVYYKDWMSISEDDESKMDVLESVDESGEYSLDLMLTHAESKISRAGALRVRGGGPKWEHGAFLGGGSEGP